MRNLCRILLSLVLAGLSAEAACAQSPVLPVASDGAFITVTAPGGCITDASGTPLANGTILIQGVDGSGTNAIPFGYGSGQSVTTPVLRTITAGSIVGTLQLVNPALSAPNEVLYHISIEDMSTYKTTNYIGVPVYLNDVPVAGRNTVFNFCKMNTGLAVTSVPTSLVQGPVGPPGIQSLPQIAATQAQALSSTIPAQANLFDYTRVSVNTAITNTGSTASVAGFDTSPYIPYLGTTIASGLIGGNAAYGMCFYDASFAKLSCTNADTPAGTPFTGPSAAAFFRFYVPVSSASGYGTLVNIATLGVYQGSTLPASYRSFGWVDQAGLNSAVAGVQGQAASIAANVVSASLPAGNNLFNYQTATTPLIFLASGSSSSAYSGFTATSYIPVAGQSSVVSNVQFGTTSTFAGVIFYDGLFNQLSVITGSVAAGTPIAVPSSAVFMRAWFASDSTSGQGTYLAPSQVSIVAGTVTPPAGLPFAVTSNALALTQLRPYLGKNFAGFGDSIFCGVGSTSGTYNTVQAVATLLGGNYSSVKCKAGISMGEFFTSGSGFTAPQASDLANVDVLLLELGTNVHAGSLGAITDTPATGDAASVYAQALYALQTIHGLNPGTRVIGILPYQNANANAAANIYNTTGNGGTAAPMNAAGRALFWATRQALIDVYNYFGDPYVDLYTTSGVNSYTASTYLSPADDIHPSQFGYVNMLTPTIARDIIRFARQ